jgi:hypothetical protein
MDEIEMAVSVLAAVTLPLIGIGPMLMRAMGRRVFAAIVLSCAAIVLMLSRAPWAAVLTLCAGAALVFAHRRADGRSRRSANAVYIDEGDALSR